MQAAQLKNLRKWLSWEEHPKGPCGWNRAHAEEILDELEYLQRENRKLRERITCLERRNYLCLKD